MVLQITVSVTAEDSTVQINTGKYYVLLKDNQKLHAKKYFNKSGVSKGERAKKE
jgi:hypothetical protein